MERFGPAILVEAGPHRILVDAGRGAIQRLMQAGGADLVPALDLVLITHLHSDHVVGLPDVWLTGWIFGRSRPLPVRGPAGTAAMMENLAKAFAFDIQMRRDADERFPAAGIETDARDVTPGLVFDADGLKVTAFDLDHGPVKPALGYRVDYRGRSAVFSGDTRPSEALVLAAGGVDVLVHEVIAPKVEWTRAKVKDPERIQKIIDHHTTPEDAGRVFARVKPRLAVYSHIVPSPAGGQDLTGPTRKTYSGPLAVGYDLMQIEVGETVKVSRRKVVSDR
jgi:ribonuclease Z